MSRFNVLLCLALWLSASALFAQTDGVAGYWKEPGGSIIHIESCGSELCASLVEISAAAPSREDHRNPEATLRQRSLCGLRIGFGFHMNSPTKATDGRLYDPKSGRTYHGTMESHGGRLDLRGYIGFSIFGRTETWTRTSETRTCLR